MPADFVEAQLAQLGTALLTRADELAATMLALMRREVGFHRTVALVSDDELRTTVRTHLDFIIGAFGAATLYLHPNTVGQRLRKLEQYTGLSAQ